MAALASQMFCYLAETLCRARGAAQWGHSSHVRTCNERERKRESVINWRIMDTLTSKHFRKLLEKQLLETCLSSCSSALPLSINHNIQC